ncbi:MAG: hypothetical protein HOY75_13240 [Streptomyces sp.]|nr:hypothetical protein [Streptomyces sp.]
MTRLNLDRNKQYDHEYSDDRGRTWTPTNTNCSAMVEADVAVADREGQTVTVNGQIVIIDEGDSMTRWTPRS